MKRRLKLLSVLLMLGIVMSLAAVAYATPDTEVWGEGGNIIYLMANGECDDDCEDESSCGDPVIPSEHVCPPHILGNPTYKKFAVPGGNECIHFYTNKLVQSCAVCDYEVILSSDSDIKSEEHKLKNFTEYEYVNSTFFDKHFKVPKNDYMECTLKGCGFKIELNLEPELELHSGPIIYRQDDYEWDANGTGSHNKIQRRQHMCNKCYAYYWTTVVLERHSVTIEPYSEHTVKITCSTCNIVGYVTTYND